MDSHRDAIHWGCLHRTNYREILRLHSLGLNNTRIAESCGCARSTVISTLRRAGEQGITWDVVRGLSETDVAARLFPAASSGRQYRMPDYEKIHRELQRPGVTQTKWAYIIRYMGLALSHLSRFIGTFYLQRKLSGTKMAKSWHSSVIDTV